MANSTAATVAGSGDLIRPITQIVFFALAALVVVTVVTGNTTLFQVAAGLQILAALGIGYLFWADAQQLRTGGRKQITGDIAYGLLLVQVIVFFFTMFALPTSLFLVELAVLVALAYALRSHLSYARAMMYIVLVFYALISIFPFFWMVSASLMTLGEVTNSRYLLPRDINLQSDITPCIIYARQISRSAPNEPVQSRRGFVIKVPPEAMSVQQYGFRSATDTTIILNTYRDDGVFDPRGMSTDDIITNLQQAGALGANGLASNQAIRYDIFRLPFFSNYCAAWDAGNLGQYMWTTVKLTLITVAGTMVFATLTAYAFARMDFVGKDLLFGVMLATLMIPGIVQNLPNVLLVTRIGELFGNQGWFMETFGFSFCDARNCWINNWPALTIPFMAPAISIFLLRQHFAGIPGELWDAARIDGAGHVRFLLQVVIPLSKAALLVVLLFAFIGAWNDLAWPLLVTVGSDEWRPIAVGLQAFLSEEGNFPHLQMAGNMITIFPILVLYAFTQRQFIEGLSSSGLKG